jgi:dTDP-L-rhamnose 4-epimerase
VRVLITGGAGFIGSRLGGRLVGSGHDVVVFDSFHPQVHGTTDIAGPEGVALLPGDVRDPDDWDRCFALFGVPDIVFHLAAETGTGQSLTEASRHGSVNVVGTTEMTDAFVRAGAVPEHIVLTSSRAVYGEGAWQSDADGVFYAAPRRGDLLAAGVWDPPSPSDAAARPCPHSAAETWARPSNVYAATKLAQEHVLDSWCSAFRAPLSILRLQNVYGPGQAIGNSYTGVLTHFARQIAEGAQVEVYEDGRIIRDFVFVDDVVDALLAALDRPPEGTRRLDIGGGVPVTLFDVASTMARHGGAGAPVVNGRYRLGDVRAASADVSAATRELGWAPSTSLDHGLGRLVSWVAERC